MATHSDGPLYLPRIADSLLERQLRAMGAVLIEGVKACGKTETARQKATSEVLLDRDPDAEDRAHFDPALILPGDTPRLLDEWQRVEPLWDAVRREVDHRRKRGQFILAGSSTPADDVKRHSGAGRMGRIKMRTMTLFEKQASSPTVSVANLFAGETTESTNCPLTVSDYLRHVTVGGWPMLINDDAEAAQDFLDSYLDSIAETDIKEVAGGTRNPRLVRRFLHAYAQMTAQPATFAAIMKRSMAEYGESGPSRNSAEVYHDALSRMMIIDEVPAWDPSVRSSKRLTTAPKRHLADPSLAAALLGMSPARLLEDLETAGFLFESLVAHDLRVYAEAVRAWTFHYREAEGRLEVDYILENRDGQWIGVEVKLGRTEIDKAAKSLLRLADRVARKPKALLVVTGTSYAYTREDGVQVVPLGLLGP